MSALPGRETKLERQYGSAGEAQLSPRQLQQLHERLLVEGNSIRARMKRHVQMAIDDERPSADEMDVAARAQEQAMWLRLADKDRKLLVEVEHALAKFDQGTYGLCEGSEEPIGWKRLQARPWARYSVEYKERLERQERSVRR